MVKGPGWPVRPSVVRALRARQDPAWSKARGPDKTQRGQSPEGQTRPSVVKGPEWSGPKEARQTQRRSEHSEPVKSSHEPVPECQQARVPRNPPLPRLFFTGRGRHVPAPSGGASGLSFCCVLPPSLLSSFVFPCWFPGSCLEAGGAQ